MDIKKSTKEVYERQLDKIDFDVFKTDVETLIKKVEEKYPDSLKSQVVLFSSILWKLKNENEKLYKSKIEKISKEIITKNEIQRKKDGEGKYTQRELDKYENWNVIYTKGNAFVNDDKNNVYERLIVALYIYLPPRRGEYATMTYSPEMPTDTSKNYVVGKNDFKILLGDYKTSRTYGTISIDLKKVAPKINDLLREMITDLDIKEGEKIFLGLSSVNSFIKKIGRIFGKLLGKPEDGGYINILRHSFINAFFKTKPNLNQRKALSLLMGHSVEMGLEYDKS